MADRSVIEVVRESLPSLDGLKIHFDPPAEEPQSSKTVPLAESSLRSAVLQYLETAIPTGLFTHQHDAIEAVLQGTNTVVATRTSSGKSLIYSLPVFDAICRDRNATALFIYPQKALANDQLIKLRSMAEGIAPLAPLLVTSPHLVSRYDGSTRTELRPEIRQSSQILLTNPDMLHLGILQHYDRLWDRFFRNLSIVAIDECHEYRGIFGTNVAYVLRRLRQICEMSGSSPRFVATSATVQDPQAHMEHLVGQEFTCIGPHRDGSLQGRRKFWIVSGEDHHYDTGRKLALELAKAGLTVLAFCPSRVAAERMVSRAVGAKDAEESYIRVYRSGLSAEDRESIENGLRDRTVRLVFSTSALELGIDIGEIDVVLCVGLPHTMMSLWQRAGRTARSGREGATIFIPADTPIDTYFANNPEELFSRDHEPLVLNLSNPRILCQQYACAVQEVGGDEDKLSLELLGEEIRRIHELRSEGTLNRAEFYRPDPHAEVSIRSAGDGSYALMIGDEKIGDIDSFHLLREAYRNAIYRHGGKSFRVKDVVRGKRLVALQPEYSKNETSPYISKKIRFKNQFSVAEYPGVRVATVAIDVTECIVSATEKTVGGETVRTYPGNALGMAPHQLPTKGTMLLLKKDFWDRAFSDLRSATMPALQSVERLVWGLFPTISGPCDTQDFSSGIDKVATGENALYLYDMVYDGVGLTEAAFDRMVELLEKSAERLNVCDCLEDIGCFRCIANPHAETPASKVATAKLLNALLEELRNNEPSIMRSEEDWTSSLLGVADTPTCGICDAKVPSGSKFCPNCGAKQGEF